MSIKACSVADCTTVMKPDQRLRKGFCPKHYARSRKHIAEKPVSDEKAKPLAGCKHCGEAFSKRSSRHYYCTPRCRWNAKELSRGLTCYICTKPMLAGSTSCSQGEAAHNKCRKANPLARHGYSAYRRGCRCDTCREAANLAMREYTARRIERDGYSPSSAAKRKKRGIDPAASWDCYICKKPLKNAARGARPMHKECRSSASEWLRKGLPNPKVTAFRKKIERAAKGTSGGKRVFIVGGCSWCGEYVVSLGKYCSDKCKTLTSFKKRSSGSTFKISPKKRLEIYVRDGWQCQLCSYPVSPDEHYLSDYAASLDHIIPQSQQLLPDHSPRNLRLVHRWCNSSRGDGSNMSDEEFQRRVLVKFGGLSLAA